MKLVMKKRGVVVLILISVLVLSVVFYFLFFTNRTCNDGTPFNKCSKTNPYFCSNGNLVQKASICGCEIGIAVRGYQCISPYEQGPKNITLNYVLRGAKGKIDFVVYKAMADNLSLIPRYLNSNENPTLLDFKLRMINQPDQKELLMPLVVDIEQITSDKTDQARIAISLVQNIPFGNSTKVSQFGSVTTEYQRYPYEVLYDDEGICSEKSELLIFLLRELGYGTASLYYAPENHEAVGIKCPAKRANAGGFCFVETTGPSIITDDRTDYFGAVRELTSSPQVINISNGISLGNDLYEYEDAKILIGIRNDMKKYGSINPVEYIQFNNLKYKYGLIDFSQESF